MTPREGPGAPLLFVSEEDRADLDAWLKRHGLQDVPLALLHPGNRRITKRGRVGRWRDDKSWPLECWAGVACALLARDPDLRVVLSGTAKEKRLLTSIAGAVPSTRVFSASHDLPVRRLLALLERAVAMISVDTGPAHAAAALGCPLIVLYGAARPAQWLPRGPEGGTVVAIGGPPRRRRVSEISLDEVLEALRSLPFRSPFDGPPRGLDPFIGHAQG